MKTNSNRASFDKQIENLKSQLLVLGSMVEGATLKAVEALKSRDYKSAQVIYDNDQAINRKRFEIENTCIGLIAMQQPIARDLRTLASIIEVAGELERMGDYAKGIARICLMVKDQPQVIPVLDIPRMGTIVTDMLHRALGAFIAADAEQAALIPLEDDQVDDLYNQVYRVLLSYMISDPTTIDWGNYHTWAAHNLERMADRVTNICERTIYVATGELKELSKSDDEFDWG
jgi:phosphate transport system protein